jgi:polyisoprenoid-binding protein YceI
MSKYLKATALLAASAAMLAASPITLLKGAPESRVWVAGTSTVKSFKCAAPAQDANLLSAGEPATAELAKLVSAADVKIEIEKLDCGNGTMNEHMRKALNAKDNPTIAFKLSGYQITNGTITVKGMLTINGQERAVEMNGNVSEENGVVRTAATREINMTEWGVKPPSLMMGTMKVRPQVTIGYDIVVKR